VKTLHTKHQQQELLKDPNMPLLLHSHQLATSLDLIYPFILGLESIVFYVNGKERKRVVEREVRGISKIPVEMSSMWAKSLLN